MIARRPCPGAWSRSRGLTLIEVMIAVVVLSIGLLGLAALKASSLKGTHSSYQRTVASVIAADAGERLWASLATGSIDAAEVEEQWLEHWRGGPENLITLPGLEGRIENSDQTYTITVSWDEGRFEDTDEQRSSFSYLIHVLGERP